MTSLLSDTQVMYHKIEASEDGSNESIQSTQSNENLSTVIKSSQHQQKYISFKSHFIPNTYSQMNAIYAQIAGDKFRDINPYDIVNSYIFDIAVIILYLITLISHILALMTLNAHRETTLFAISLTLILIGSIISVIWAFFYGYEIIITMQNLSTKIFCYLCIITLSIPFGPLIFLLWVRYMEYIKNHTKLINLLLYCLGVSFGQSALMLICIITIDYHWTYLFSLISCILLIIIGLICVSIENKDFTIIKFMPVPLRKSRQ